MCKFCAINTFIKWDLCIEGSLRYISTRHYRDVQRVAAQKEAVVVFICYIGNKDTNAVYPKSLCVNKQNVLEALLWLKKHNSHYANITINESNLDWMNGQK
jgi:hypothetical protein